VRHRVWQWAGLIVVGVGLLALVINTGLLPDAVAERAESIVRNLRLFDVRTVAITPESFAVVERMAQIQAAWGMVLDYPLTGVGPGNYTQAYEGIGSADRQPYLFHPWYTSRGHAHNYYLHMTAEAGIFGLFTYLLLLWLLAMQLYATLIYARGWFWRSLGAGGCGIIAAVAVHNLFENLHVLNMGVQMGAVWGLMTAIEINMKQGHKMECLAGI
jgi:O-antigen ligase